MDFNTDNRTDKILRKKRHEKNGDIHCAICPYHDNENYRHTDNRSWKTNRKNQYKR